MNPIKLLIDPQRLSADQISHFAMVRRLLTQRCQLHFFDLNLAGSINANETLDTDAIIKKGIKVGGVRNDNRVLLEVERIKQQDKIRENAKRAEWQTKASQLYHRELKKDMEIYLSTATPSMVCGGLSELMGMLYDPNTDYKTLIDHIGRSEALTVGLLNHVVKEQRRGNLTRVDIKNQSMKGILGQIGKATLENLLPLLLIRQMVKKESTAVRPATDARYRRLLTHNVNYAVDIMTAVDKNNPYYRFSGLVGVLEGLWAIIIYRLFCQRHEEVRIRLMSTWRDQSQHTLHTALQSVEVNYNVLAVWIDQLKPMVQEIFINQADWSQTRVVRRALEEHQENIPLHHRSDLGVILNHSYQFAQFKTLADSKLTGKSLITQYFYASYIPNDLSRPLLSSTTTEFV